MPLRGGYTPNAELSDFMNSLRCGKQRLREDHDGSPVFSAAEQQLTKTEALSELEERLKSLQRELGRRTRGGGQGRYWELPSRRSAAKAGVLTKDALALQLQKSGFNFREARELVGHIFQVMIEGLRRGEDVVTDLGTFQVKNNPPLQVRTRLGRRQKIYQQRKKVVFKPTETLRARLLMPGPWPAAEPAEKGNPMQPTNQRLSCEKCGSTSFSEVCFRHFYNLPSSLPGGGLMRVENENEDAIPMLICLCGNLVPLGPLRKQVPGDQWIFAKSVAAALHYREGANPQALIQRLDASFARKDKQDALEERVQSIESIFERLPTAPATNKD
jgi:nucleoid DNA-binding protein